MCDVDLGDKCVRGLADDMECFVGEELSFLSAICLRLMSCSRGGEVTYGRWLMHIPSVHGMLVECGFVDLDEVSVIERASIHEAERRVLLLPCEQGNSHTCPS